MREFLIGCAYAVSTLTAVYALTKIAPVLLLSDAAEKAARVHALHARARLRALARGAAGLSTDVRRRRT